MCVCVCVCRVSCSLCLCRAFVYRLKEATQFERARLSTGNEMPGANALRDGLRGETERSGKAETLRDERAGAKNSPGKRGSKTSQSKV